MGWGVDGSHWQMCLSIAAIAFTSWPCPLARPIGLILPRLLPVILLPQAHLDGWQQQEKTCTCTGASALQVGLFLWAILGTFFAHNVGFQASFCQPCIYSILRQNRPPIFLRCIEKLLLLQDSVMALPPGTASSSYMAAWDAYSTHVCPLS